MATRCVGPDSGCCRCGVDDGTANSGGPPHEVAHSISVEAFRSVSTEIAGTMAKAVTEHAWYHLSSGYKKCQLVQKEGCFGRAGTCTGYGMPFPAI